MSAVALGGSGALGGAALTSAIGTGNRAESVRVEAQSFGGSGETGGVAELGMVFGRSPGGGDVTVLGTAVAGFTSFGVPPGPRTSAQLVNAVDGLTSGSLTLGQTAVAQGEALSLLAKEASTEHLALSSVAIGAGANALADATNRTGVAQALASAEGIGGDAASEARATGFADGAAVLVNLPISGLEGGPFQFGARTSPQSLGAPGDATSVAMGTHLGDGEVTVVDQARAAASFDLDYAGGSASSHASATNAGRSAVSAAATAVGGDAFAMDAVRRPAGGDAVALAEALGRGEASASARAEAGVARTIEHSGTAIATAAGEGQRIALEATAVSHELLEASISASARRAVTVEASEAAGALTQAGALPLNAWANAAHSVSDEALAAALQGDAAVAEAMSSASVLALGAIGGAGTVGGLHFEAEITIGAALLGASVVDELLIGFLGASLNPSTSLRIEIHADGESVYGRTLRASSLSSFDPLLRLDVAPAESLVIAVGMTLPSGRSTGSIGFVVSAILENAGVLAVPEPRLVLLLGTALLALLVRRRGPSRRRGGQDPRI
jgi:hypothetical protein